MTDASATDMAREVLARYDAWWEGRLAMSARTADPFDLDYPSERQRADSDLKGLYLAVEIAEVLRALLHPKA